MVVSLVAEQQLVEWLGDLISAQEIVHVANTIFLQDQVRAPRPPLILRTAGVRCLCGTLQYGIAVLPQVCGACVGHCSMV